MYKDIVEQTIRPANHLTIDHRFPKLRWSDTYAEKDKTDMSANGHRNKCKVATTKKIKW